MTYESTLDAETRSRGLQRLISAWELSPTDMGSIFGISRRDIDVWRENPPARVPGLVALLAATCILEDRGSGEVHDLVRRPREDLDGYSLLETACQARPERVLETVVQWRGLREAGPPL